MLIFGFIYESFLKNSLLTLVLNNNILLIFTFMAYQKYLNK